MNRSTLLFEVLALVAGIVSFNKYRKSVLFLFLPFLLYICITEFLASTFYTCSNHLLFNPVLMMENGIFLFCFLFIFKSKLLRGISKIIMICFVIITLLDIWHLESFSQNVLSTSFNIGRIFILIEYFLYLIILLQSDDYLDLSRNLFFWASTGIFIFILMTFLRDTLLGLPSELTINEKYIIKMMGFIASNILYSFFIIGFIRCKKIIHV